jgi:integrase
MARQMFRLTARKVETVRKAGLYADGGNLFLQVTEGGPKSWIFRYSKRTRNAKGRFEEGWMGLGSLNAVGLAKARQLAAENRALLAERKDPQEVRKTKRIEAALAAANTISFDEAARRYIAAHSAGWRNPKHHAQWESTLKQFCSPVFGSMPVSTVDTALVLKVLEPIWTEKHETALRLRGRIEKILDWAKARDYRVGENPARWRGHLDKLLANVSRRRRTVHFASMVHAEVPAFFATLGEQDGIAADALAFTILCACRTNETIGARWSEIDLQNRVWAVPGNRMKSGRDFRVPLSPAAVKLLESLPGGEGDSFVFPGQKRDRPLSNMALAMTLRRMKRDEVTVHGFRSSFRNWCAELTNHSREVVEAALAHVVESATEAAYFRSDLFERRRKLMNDWARYVTASKPAANVVPIAGKAAA